MKKIGILTFFETCNYGAYWQAFSLLKTIESLGCEAQVINYVNPLQMRNLLITLFFTKNPVRIFSNLRKLIRFKLANHSLKLTRRISHPKDIEGFDCIVVGSDIVWNYVNRYLGQDSIFFGVGLKINCVAYAPSFGTVSPETLMPQKLVEGILTFKSLSVRDENSQNIIKRWCNIIPPIVLDPTLLCELRPKLFLKPPVSKNYILVYGKYFSEAAIQQSILFGKKTGFKIISIGYNQSWCDRNVIACGPIEWATYIAHAYFVITSAFHGTVFSIKFHKPFAVELHESIRAKTLPLLKITHLQTRVIDGERNIGVISTSNIDYNPVFERLKILKSNSLNYLRSAIC